ncbi:MAG: GNAT family N-acetyltransferase [Dongiaceae bacterium]
MRKQVTESNPVSFGPARPEDAGAIAAVIQRAFAAYRGTLQPEPSALKETEDSIRSALGSESFVIARQAGRVIGCVSVKDRAGVAYARRLAVEPAQQGKGLGRALMMEAEALARRLGFNRLHVETRLALAGNRALFRVLGFQEGTQHCHPGFTHPTYVELEKILV